jgi:hypothetical protein
MVDGGPLKMNTNECNDFLGINHKGSERCANICLCIDDKNQNALLSGK